MTKRKPRVAVFFGGSADNQDLSVETGRWMFEHMPRTTYEVVPVHVTDEGAWQVPLGSLPGSGDALRAVDMLQAAVPALPPAQALPRLLERGVDIVFPVLRGAGGDDGGLAAVAEMMGLSTVGSPPATCVITADKHACAQAIEAMALSPLSLTIRQHDIPEEAAASAQRFFSGPVFVKPNATEGSLGVHLAEHEDELIAAIRQAQRHGNSLVQQARAGEEVTVTVYTDEEGHRRVLPATVVTPLKAKFFDALAKRRGGRVALSTGDLHQARQLALDIYEHLRCQGVVSVDMIVAEGGGIDVLEVNTIPAAGPHLPLPHQLRAAGQTASQFLDSVIRGSLERL